MSTEINTGFISNSAEPLDNRVLLSKAEMKAMNDSVMPDKYFCICKDDGCLYLYNKANSVDKVLGKYRLGAEPQEPERPATVYSFHITDANDVPSPEKGITYTGANAQYVPIQVNGDAETPTVTWNSWNEDEFFMPRPCMLKSDGTVAYYLDPYDYSKKEDGTPSDIYNLDFDGNAMMEWGRDGQLIWIKVVPGEDYASRNTAEIYVANNKVDDGYHAWSFIGKDKETGEYVYKEHFYTAIYNGSQHTELGSAKLRSMDLTNSGKAVTDQYCKADLEDGERYAELNGDGWMIDTFSDRCMIYILLMLLTKTRAPHLAIGYGIYDTTAGAALQPIGTVSTVTSGLFYGSTKNGKKPCKVFGMENWWGSMYRPTLGYAIKDPEAPFSFVITYKMCLGKEDGSTCNMYETREQGEHYINSELVPDGDGYILRHINFRKDGALIPESTVDGSTTSFYAVKCNYDATLGDAYFGGAINQRSNPNNGPLTVIMGTPSTTYSNPCLTYR